MTNGVAGVIRAHSHPLFGQVDECIRDLTSSYPADVCDRDTFWSQRPSPASRDSAKCGWRLLSFVTTALFVPVFLLNFRALNEPWVILSWLAIAMTDPCLEEGYWRG